MMKTDILNAQGKKVKEIELPKVFSTKIRKDVLQKVFETEKVQAPYGPNPESGKHHSASGIARHLRHVWKSGYGGGRSRTPRKIMWRRGSQFYWVGAEVSSTRGGRRAHPPKPLGTFKIKKINKKERQLAFASAIASTTNSELVVSRYSRIDKINKKLPIVVESKLLNLKTKELVEAVEKVLGELKVVGKSEKKVRAGIGKLRNRKYKKSAGALIITGDQEELKTKAINSRKVKNLEVADLYPAGRVVIYTEEAIKDLGAKK